MKGMNMSVCTIGEPCVSRVMSMIEKNPVPFILETEPLSQGGKLSKIIRELPLSQDIPLEYFIGRDKLLSFMFNNDFPPIAHTVSDPAIIPLPMPILLSLSAITFLAFLRGRGKNAT